MADLGIKKYTPPSSESPDPGALGIKSFTPLTEWTPEAPWTPAPSKVGDIELPAEPPSYGPRPDGTAKGRGFFGPLKRSGGVSTELSIGVAFDGKEVQIPALVPTLSAAEVTQLLTMGDTDKVPEPIVKKAVAFAKTRLAAGHSPFADEGEQDLGRYPQLPRVGQPYQAVSAEGVTAPDSVKVTPAPDTIVADSPAYGPLHRAVNPGDITLRPDVRSAEGVTDPASVRVTNPPLARPTLPASGPTSITQPATVPEQEPPAPPAIEPKRDARELTMSPVGLFTLKVREGGFQPYPYKDSGGWAIGYGMQTWQGKRVTADTPPITEEDADAELDRQIAHDRAPVLAKLKVPVTQAQYDALISVAWNHKATAEKVVDKLNASEPVDVGDFSWSATVKGQPHAGLLQRRLDEYAPFAPPSEPLAIARGPVARGVAAQGVTAPASVKVTEPGSGVPPVPTMARRFTGLQPLTTPMATVPEPLTEGAPELVRGAGELMKGVPLTGAPGQGPISSGQTGDDLLNAAADVIDGAVKLSTPLVASGLITAPIRTALVATIATIAGKGAKAATQQLGGSDAAQRFVEAVAAGIGAGVIGSKEVAKWTSDTAQALALTAKLSGRATGIQGPPAEALAPGPRAPIASVVTQPEAFVEGAVPGGGETLTDVIRTAAAPEGPPIRMAEGRDRLVPAEPPPAADVPRGTPPVEVDPNAAHLAEAAAQPPAPQDLTAIASGRALERRLADRQDETRALDIKTFKPADAEEHTYSSTQVNLPEDLAAKVRAVGEQIPDTYLMKDGRETQPHVTVKYGLHTEDADQVRALLENEPPITVTLGKTSVFPNGESGNGDVVKIDVDSPDLHRLNAKIADALPVTDTYPEYQPHVTIAYVKPGMGEKVAKKIDSLAGQTMTLDSVTFSSKDGTTTTIPLAGGRHAVDEGVQPEGDLGEHRRDDQVGVQTRPGGGGVAGERAPAPVAGREAPAAQPAQEIGGLVPPAAPETSPQKIDVPTLEHLATDEAMGVTFDEQTGESHLPGGGSAVNCTNCGERIIQMVGEGEIYGWSDGDNPTSVVSGPTQGAHADKGQGHDFAVIRGRYLVDPWAKNVEGSADRAAYDLDDPADRAEVLRLYGDPHTWSRRNGAGWTKAMPPALRAHVAAPEPPKSRLLIVDTVTGKSDVSAGRELGRKEVLIAEKPSGEVHILRMGDQVTPTGRSKILKGNYTAPEAAAALPGPLEPEMVQPPEKVVPDTETGVKSVGFTENSQAANRQEVVNALVVRYNADRHSIEIKFKAKPDARVLDAVRSGGYRWAKNEKLWYRKLDPKVSQETGLANANQMIGAVMPAPAAVTPPPKVTPPAAGRSYDHDTAQATFKAFKTALTRAVNAAEAARTQKMPPAAQGERWKAVIAEADRFNTYYDSSPEPTPDDWARWARAKDDALLALQRLNIAGSSERPATATPGFKVEAIGGIPISGKDTAAAPKDVSEAQAAYETLRNERPETAADFYRPVRRPGEVRHQTWGSDEEDNVLEALYAYITADRTALGDATRLPDADLERNLDGIQFVIEDASGRDWFTPTKENALEILTHRLERELLRRAGQQALPFATAPAEAQNESSEAPHGGSASHGAGQLPVGGESTAVRGGVAGEGALGAVSTEPGAAAPSAGRRAGARHGDTGGVVAEGVRHPAGAEPQSGAPRVAAPGTVSGRALSPTGDPVAGDAHEPGAQPTDYALTADRIQTIISRGAMQRARDNLAAIQLAKTLNTEQRYATPDEQDILAKYVGWGDSQVAQYLADYQDYRWRDTEKSFWQQIQDTTTPEERKALKASSLNAHFTFDLYRPIWDALVHAGFEKGRVLEPAVGVGHAIGFMPASVRGRSTINAVELEPLTATIAQALYPSVRVQATGYEQARIARGTQDLILSNVPFGAYGVRDPKLKPFLTSSIHNYFFAKALEHARPGGLVVFLTSRYTMDSPEHIGVRRYLMDKAHFLGAIRLPNTAFDKSAKTEVVADLIVLQRLKDGETANHADLFIQSPRSETLSSAQYKRGKMVPNNVYRSSWYDDHPELVLGTESTEGTMYGPGQYTVTAADADVAGALGDALRKLLPPGTYQPASSPATDTPGPQLAEGSFKVGEFRIVNGHVMRADRDGQLYDASPMRGAEVDQNGVKRITGMVGVRDALRATVAAMRSPHSTDAQITAAQKKLSKVYEAFIKAHGSLRSAINKRLFTDDPEATNLRELELATPTATLITDRHGKKTLRVTYTVTGRAEIFTKRTIHAPVEISHVETPHDALLASLGTKTTIDWPYMARISGQTDTALQAALKADGRIFEQPDGSWVVADDYLSGDVVSKLADAQAAAEEEPARFAPNVAALKAIQPAPKQPEEVSIPLGAHWVNVEYVQQFVADELGLNDAAAALQLAVSGTESYVVWVPSFSGSAEQAGQKHTLAVNYGPHERYVYGFTDLLSDALNLKMPSLGWYEGSGDDRKYVKDPAGTTAARANIEELRSKWRTWVAEHPEIEKALVDIYNTRFNRTVKRTYDGSHLANVVKWDPATRTGERTAALPGLALTFPLHPHQQNAVWRMLTSGNTLLAHEVGAGKTFEMIVAAMEMRRTGRARKPLITVPTYLLGQWRASILQAYPTAKILAFEEKDLEKSKRQQAMARIAFGDWDIVLVPHSSFQLLKVSDKRMAAVMQQWIDELSDAEAEARAGQGEDSLNVKKLAAQRKRIEDKVAKKLEAMNKSSDNALTWEDLGVDALMVDEAHAFKNLFFFSKIDSLRGLSRSESDRSLDLFVKVQDINEQSHYRNLFLATATPVMNSMAELFTMQRYLQPQRLREQGFENFDNWYATFAQALPTTEQRPDGTYQEVMRLRAFQNLDLLYRTMAEVMDYVGWDDMPYLKLPTLKGKRVQIIKTEPHPIYAQLKQWFTDRLAALRELPPHIKYNRATGGKEYVAPERMDPLTGKPMGRKDNILTVMTDAGLAAVDVRLVVGDRAKDVPDSRIQTAARDLYAVYKAEKAKKGVQLIFLDVGTPQAADLRPLEFLEGAKVEDETGGGALGTEEEEIDNEDVPAEADDANGFFNLYDALKEALVKKGVPSKEIAYIHQTRNAAERLALFQAANEGKVRFVFASTDKGGIGMNIQTRLAHIAHLDAPRMGRPGDIRQRDGRGIRQGNTYDEILISRYVTAGTTDEWKYGMLAQKSNLITSFMRGDVSEFTDDDPSTMSIEEAQIRATGDPRGIELTELRAAMNRLQAQATAVERAIGQARHEIQTETSRKRHEEKDLEALERWLAGHVSLVGDQFHLTVGGVVYTKRGEANAALLGEMAKVAETNPEGYIPIADAGGLRLDAVGERDDKGRRSIGLWLDGSSYSGGSTFIARVPVPPKPAKGLPPVPFGQGRDVVASVLSDYAAIPHKVPGIKGRIRDSIERIERAQKLLDQPSNALEKLRVARARVSELETELAAEGVAKDAALKAQRDTAKAELAKRVAVPSSAGAEGSAGVFTETAPVRAGRVPPTGGIQQIEPLEFPELVEFAHELVRTPQVVTRFRKEGKRGEFKGATGLIRLHADLFKKGNVRQLAATLAHEIGHLVDWLPDKSLKRGNLLGRLRTLDRFMKGTFTAPDGTVIKNKTIKTELTALSDQWRPWDPDTATDKFIAYRHSSKELYADAISVLLNNPGLLEASAPTFYKEFFKALDQKPDVAVTYFELQEVLAGTREELLARRRGRLRDGMRDGTLKALDLQRRKDALAADAKKHYGMKLRQLFVDKNAPLVDLVKDTERDLGLSIPEDENPIYLLNERNYVGGRQKAFLERDVEPIYNALQDAAVSWEDFGEALFNSRVIAGDRSEFANPFGLQPDAARELHADLAQQLGPDRWQVIEHAMRDLRTVAKTIGQEAYDEGLFSDEVNETIQENPAYAPFQVVEYMDKEINWTVKQQKGTLKAINNPADAFALKLLSTIRAIERNKMTRTTIDFLKTHHPDEIQPANTKWNGRFHEAREPEKGSHLGLISYYVKGKREGYYVDEHIADSVNNASIGHNRTLMITLNLVTGAPIFRPLFTTFNPGFMGFNFIRDFRRFWRNTPGLTIGRALKEYAAAYPVAKLRAFGTPTGYRPGRDAALDTARDTLLAAEEAKILGVTYNDLVLGSDTAPEAYIETIFAQSGIRDLENAPRSRLRRVPVIREIAAVLDKVREVGDLIETLPKVAAINYFRGGRPIDELTPSQRDFIRRMVGSPDFLSGGTMTAATNKLFLYSNAAAQGYRSDYQMARHPATMPPVPKHGGPAGTPPPAGGPPSSAGSADWEHRASGFWWKTASTVFLPKLLMYAAMLGAFGEGVRRILHRGSSEYDRTNYLVLPLGHDGPNGVIFRVPDDETNRFLGGIFWKLLGALHGDKDVVSTLQQVLSYAGGQLPNPAPMLGLAVNTAEYLAGQNPYDYFRGRNVLTDDEQKARGWFAAKKFIGWEFQELGGAIVWKFYAGEQRPQVQTKAQTFLDLPIVSNIVGRFIKSSTYGEVEELRGTAQEAGADEARRRLVERDAINAAIQKYQALPPMQKSHATQIQMTAAMAHDLYSDQPPPVREDHRKHLLKKLEMGVVRGQADPLVDVVLSAPSHAEKLAVLLKGSEGMSREEFGKWLSRAQHLDIVSQPLMADLAKALNKQHAAATGAAR